MKLRDCYVMLQGDYEGVMSRLMREASISKFLIMMLRDTQWTEFHEAVDNKDWETAFRNVHTLKGTSLNLGITKLATIASTLTEFLRNGAPTVDLTDYIADLDSEYKRTMDLIRKYSEDPEI